MLLEEIRAIKSEKKDLRNFGLTIGTALGLLGGLLWWKGKDTYIVFVILSFVFIFFGLVMSAALKPLQKAWMTLAVVLGWFMTRIILGVLFFFVFTTIRLISMLFLKERFLDLKIDKSAESYWIRREQKPFSAKKYNKQF